MVQLNFDATKLQPLDFDTIPEGWYNVSMDESTAAPTKDGNPAHLRLNLRFTILDGQFHGRKLFTGLNMRHTNVQTMEIANREFTAICQACGLPYVQDSQQLHGIPIKVRVKTRKDPNGVYDDQSEIRSYKPANYVPPGAGFVAPVQSQGQPNGGWQQPQVPPQQPQPAAAAPGPAPQGWQQPQQGQPWGQPQQPAQPQQTQPNPPGPAPTQPAPAGFAAPPPPNQAPQQPQQPQNPQPHPAQNAQPPWARQ